MPTRKTTSKVPAPKTSRPKQPKRPGPKVGLARLDELIAEATIDAHDEDERLLGFLDCIEISLKLPFGAEVLGVPVQVTGTEATGRGGILAVCRRGWYVQRLPLGDLPEPPPEGYEWVLAYRRWAGYG